MRSVFSFLLLIGVCSDSLSADQPSPAEVEYFEKKVRPLLAKRCYSCHSSEAKIVQGGLKLDTATAVRSGGDSGPVVVPGKPKESLLITAIQYDRDADTQMPPKGKLPDSEITELTAWVKRGAPFPGNSGIAKPNENGIDFKAARQFWSIRPVKNHPLPTTKNAAWPIKRIDHFLLATMEREGLTPSPEADRATLLRRLSFDLIGLPPTPAELKAFLQDNSPTAYEQQVERLLSSPHFGERWGRVWLDLARYTDRTASWLDSTGQAYLYRDWVVQAMNNDVPYDEFIHRQLATDMMPETGPEDSPALGFLGLSPNYWKELKLPSEIIKVIVADEWEERVDAVSRTFLGLTVACARCHDHKFDPITQQDYYALAGVFASTRIAEVPTIPAADYKKLKQVRTEVEKLDKQLAALKKKKPQPAEEIAAVTEKLTELKTSTPHYNTPMATGLVEESIYVKRKGKKAQDGTKIEYQSQPRDLHLFIRGDPNRLGELVPRRFLQVLSTDSPTPFQSGSGRLDLAHAITDDASSLTARVIVNRIWHEHFGRGLVATPSNFGLSGERPSHPELLDDLAVRFIENGWSLKWLHREIVLSTAWRQSSRADTPQAKGDPENRWYSRSNRRRLPVEAWRDAMLSATGELNLKLGGPSLSLTDPKNLRRTIYGTIHRREMSTMLLTHDFPDPTAHSPKRHQTTTALQGLYALNGPLILQQADALVRRLSSEHPDDETARIHLAYSLLFAREPRNREVEIAQSFLGETSGTARGNAWTQYAHVLLASNEFLFVD